MSIESWTKLIDTEDLCSQKLMAHFCAILLLLRPNYPKLQDGNIEREPLPALTTWIRQLSSNIVRLSQFQHPRLSKAHSMDSDMFESDSGYSASASPNSSASTGSTGFTHNFVPLQIANECDLRSQMSAWSSSYSSGLLTPDDPMDCNALTQHSI